MFASKVIFFNLEACKLVLSSMSNSPDRNFLIFFGSPIIDSTAFCIKKGDVFEISFSFLFFFMRKHVPSSLQKAFFSLKLEENSYIRSALFLKLLSSALKGRLESGALIEFPLVVAIIERGEKD